MVLTHRKKTGLRTDVQTTAFRQINGPDGVRDALRLLVKGPFNGVCSPNLPYGGCVWTEDLGNPNVPGVELHRCGEDGSSGEEEGSKGGREFHREGDLVS